MKKWLTMAQSVIKIKPFILIAFSLPILLTLIMIVMKKNQMKLNDVLRVAFPNSKSATFYEPTKIYLAPEYIFLETIYSPLIEFDLNGNLQSGVAQRFDWVENELHFEIRKDLKTIDGYNITARDVEFSLKRLMVLTGNTHGNLKDILCPHVELKSISDHCENLEVRNDYLVVLKPSKKDVFLVKMLTAIDFAIIPKISVDPNSLKIMDYRNTTGPYYVSKDNEMGKIELQVNQFHYHYNNKIAHTIIFVPTDKTKPNSSLDQFKNDQVDLLTTIDATSADKVIEFSDLMKDISNLHSTINIRTYMIGFTENGLRKTTEAERFVIGREIKSIFSEHFKNIQSYKETEQFFPLFGEGSLNDDQLVKLNTKIKQAEAKAVSIKSLDIKVIRLGSTNDLEDKIKSKFKNFTVEQGKSSLAENLKNSDILIKGPDTSFFEDITLISYTLNVGTFGLNKQESSIWLKDYMGTIDKEKRLEKLRSLHYETLMKPVIIPLMSAPYVALSRKPWVPKLSKYFANNPLWLVEKE